MPTMIVDPKILAMEWNNVMEVEASKCFAVRLRERILAMSCVW